MDPDEEVTSDLILNNLNIVHICLLTSIIGCPIFFAVSSDTISHLGLGEQEKHLEQQSDRSLKLKFKELALFQF